MDRVPGWTDTHPERTLTCWTCKVTLGGEGVTELCEQLFRSLHRGDDHTVTVTE